ncbi:MAG TPA: GntR family transcriptional regulator [Clostridia bacterium]|nr:GntR family transcriptional regulator [Clostridia bacterium]
MDLVIVNSSTEPIYEQIARQIKAMIIQGKLKPGDPLPSIRGLAKELQISVITTKRAYDELEREGLIVSVGGKGSFVAEQNAEWLREKRLKLIEEKLAAVVRDARLVGLSLAELQQMLELLYEEV